MGNSESSLVDCVCDGDIQALKTQLLKRREEATEQYAIEVEDAVHTVVGMEIASSTSQQFQQMQIALELLLQAQPTAWHTTLSNSIRWTASHRACVTGNLSLAAFASSAKYVACDMLPHERDAFGLFPVDLVPPELLLSPTDEAKEGFPGSERHVLALQILRKGKALAQAKAIKPFLPVKAPEQVSDNQLSDNQLSDDQQQLKDPTQDFYIAFAPNHDHLDATNGDNCGHVHECGAPLRLKYCLPHVEEFVNGYFQLIWRAESDPRSEEPQYDQHVLMRDELFLDQSPCEEGPTLLSLHVHEKEATIQQASEQQRRRRLMDARPVMQGCFPFEISHLPADAVCHALFIASDRHLMKRTIVLSTEGIALRTPDDFGDNEWSISNQDDDDDEEDDEEDDQEQEEEHDQRQKYVFSVAGENFRHASPALAGQAFQDLDEFETFVKGLHQNQQQQEEEKSELQGSQHGTHLQQSG